MVFKGRLGLDTAKVPQADRHGLMWLERGRLRTEDGNVVFITAGSDVLEAGRYDIAVQQVSVILLGPGGAVTHDALRILARYDTGLLAVGSKGVRLYAASLPFGPDASERARRHAALWADPDRRVDVARQMFARRFGDDLPSHARDLDTLRGIESSRVKKMYRNVAQRYGVSWDGRQYDRNDPESDDAVNQAINHAASAVYGAARVAVAVSGAVAQLGFIHEASGHAFALDVADLYRGSTTLPVAFQAVKKWERRPNASIERITRKQAGTTMYEEQLIPAMIDDIKTLLDDDDRRDA